MTTDQAILFAILAATVAAFAWGRWRHDIVALGALLATVLAGLVPGAEAFNGFGHPAVITVAGVLVLSRSLQTSGAVDAMARKLLPADAGPIMMIAGLTSIAAVLSGFMNNVGALALLMPVALKAARNLQIPPGRLLMPLAFGSILGGMTTLIGTPPNLIVSGYRREALGEAFGMFDYTPVGAAIALAGVVFITLVGWRLVPKRQPAGIAGFESGSYVTEARVPEGGKAAGLSVQEVEGPASDGDVQVLGLIRNDMRLDSVQSTTRVLAGDVLILETEPDDLPGVLSSLDLTLEQKVEAEREKQEAADDKAAQKAAAKEAVKDAVAETAAAVTDKDAPGAEEPVGGEETAEEQPADEKPESRAKPESTLTELVVPPNAAIIGRSPMTLNVRTRYRINILAISRNDKRTVGRLRSTQVTVGDVLLVDGPAEAVSLFAADYGCLPLAERALHIPSKREALLAAGILLAAVAAAASGLLSAPVAFALGVLVTMVSGVLPLRSIYNSVDWPVVVLLACLLPVAGAMLTTGAAALLADFLVTHVAQGMTIVSLLLILVVTMTLSDIMNNAATVAVMAPIAHGAATALGANPDAFLMAVAIGGSCAFLTPIGHQNNTLILGPGGFHFGDYWPLGVPLEIIVVAVSIPMLLLVWGV